MNSVSASSMIHGILPWIDSLLPHLQALESGSLTVNQNLSNFVEISNHLLQEQLSLTAQFAALPPSLTSLLHILSGPLATMQKQIVLLEANVPSNPFTQG